MRKSLTPIGERSRCTNPQPPSTCDARARQEERVLSERRPPRSAKLAVRTRRWELRETCRYGTSWVKPLEKFAQAFRDMHSGALPRAPRRFERAWASERGVSTLKCHKPPDKMRDKFSEHAARYSLSLSPSSFKVPRGRRGVRKHTEQGSQPLRRLREPNREGGIPRGPLSHDDVFHAAPSRRRPPQPSSKVTSALGDVSARRPGAPGSRHCSGQPSISRLPATTETQSSGPTSTCIPRSRDTRRAASLSNSARARLPLPSRE